MVEVPLNVLRLMWEYDEDSLIQGSEVPDAIVERVMALGGWSEMQWLLRTVDRERLRTFLTERGSRVLPARELSFWTLACEIPEETAAVWCQDARRREYLWRG